MSSFTNSTKVLYCKKNVSDVDYYQNYKYEKAGQLSAKINK